MEQHIGLMKVLAFMYIVLIPEYHNRINYFQTITIHVYDNRHNLE